MLKGVKHGGSIVCDATHASDKNRQVWVDLANNCNVDYIILWCCRDGRSFNSLRPCPNPLIAYSIYTKYFIQPYEKFIIVS